MQESTELNSIPAESLHRLALYHCKLTDMLLERQKNTITSKEMAKALGLNESTIRRDLMYIGESSGKRGAGYNISLLRRMIGEFLSLPSFAPIAIVGSTAVSRAIFEFFPIEKFGFTPAAFFSEDPRDQDAWVNGREVQPIEAISPALSAMGVKVAMVATHPTWLKHSIDLLANAGIKSILVLTQIEITKAPEGVHIMQLGITCGLKSLFYYANQLEHNDKPSVVEQVVVNEPS